MEMRVTYVPVSALRKFSHVEFNLEIFTAQKNTTSGESYMTN
jgi:hypothetical protein